MGNEQQLQIYALIIFYSIDSLLKIDNITFLLLLLCYSILLNTYEILITFKLYSKKTFYNLLFCWFFFFWKFLSQSYILTFPICVDRVKYQKKKYMWNNTIIGLIISDSFMTLRRPVVVCAHDARDFRIYIFNKTVTADNCE